jgi:hypothetical protein
MVFLMLLRRLGRSDLTGHGFRSTFRDWAAEKTHSQRSVRESALRRVVHQRAGARAAARRARPAGRRRSIQHPATEPVPPLAAPADPTPA